MKKKIIVTISVLAILLVATSFFWLWDANGSSSPQYRMDKVSKGDVQVVVTATGTLSAVTTVEVGTQVSGTISKLLVDFNDHVKKGQIIAQIDPTFLEASVRDAEANLQRSRAQDNEAGRNFQRTKILLEKGLAAQADYDAALATYESSKATVKQAEAQLERAKINLRYSTIRAPIDGIVISRAVDIGQTVAASLSAPTIFSIANDLTKMQVQANVDEADVGRVKVNQDVTFTVDAYPDEVFKGTVRQIRLAPTTIQNVVNYTVIIDVPNPLMKLMPGMTATVTINVAQSENALRVPTLALRFNPPTDQIETRRDSTGSAGDSARAQRRHQFMERMTQGGGGRPTQMGGGARNFSRVWILNSNKKLEPVFVRTGLSDGTYTEIVRGKLEEGQEIVTGIVLQRTQSTTSSSPFGPQPGGGGGMRRGF